MTGVQTCALPISETLKPFLETYGKDFLNDFYKYWTEPNKSNTKFRQELEKTWDLLRRLETWAKNEKNFKKNNYSGGEKIDKTTRFMTAYLEGKAEIEKQLQKESEL